ncbi:uncharacterized protein BJ212DRAFT_1303889 [Suillus subaureus]|uniref:Uncharacterized protein n=1 Tax=Suillus subaureus TaxID=48587 RepID=A0A9P7J6L4_9AGAM|nr:uncharacterized protein BJ212DRAFT_1303889 [Suillus subaureus]KAG1805824.1 hypothetical protein BJ212DRAFT_1303889 [Suillus subaureus]
MQKFHNDLGGSKAGSKPKTSHILKLWEMYLKMHYGKIKDAVKKEQEELKNVPSTGPAKKTTLNIVKQHIKQAFNNKSEEVKAEVLAAVETMKETKCAEIEAVKNQCHDINKDVALRYISKIATILTQFFKELHEMTDWVFTVLMGGPHPDMGRVLDVSSFHVGTTKLGNWFSQAYPHFSQNVMVPYTQFIECVFSEAATLLRGKDLLPGSTMSSTLAITP